MSEQLYTTKRLLRKYNACRVQYAHLVSALGPMADNAPIPLVRILESNGLDDALWALRAVPQKQRTLRDRLARLYACRCVRETPLGDGRTVWNLLLPNGPLRSVVEISERYAVGDATMDDLDAAQDAAWDSVERNAIFDAVLDSARGSALASADVTACNCAWAAAFGITPNPARDATWLAAREFQARLFTEMFGGDHD